MPAKLSITAGPLAGSELWIEYDVVRLGADDDCELQLVDAGLDPHVFTLRYSDGRYLLYNRSPQSLKLDSKAVEPNGSDTWRHGKTLQLPGGTSLKLETSGDGAPEVRAADAPLPSLAASAEAMQADVPVPVGGESGEAPAAKKTGQTVVVGLLFAAVIGVLLMEEPTAGAPGTKVKSFVELSADLRKDSSLTPDLWIRFSEAHAAAYRGRAAEADAAYRRLRDRLEWEKTLLEQAGKSVSPTLLDAEAYVKQRVAGAR